MSSAVETRSAPNKSSISLPAVTSRPVRSRTSPPTAACICTVRCADGIYWFRLFPLRYWDTRRLPDGRYRLRVRAWDVAGNLSEDYVVVRIANGEL